MDALARLLNPDGARLSESCEKCRGASQPMTSTPESTQGSPGSSAVGDAGERREGRRGKRHGNQPGVRSGSRCRARWPRRDRRDPPPPNNFFDYDLIHELANVYERLDADPRCRAIVLCSEGRHFCAGADFSARGKWSRERLDRQAGKLYVEAARVFSCTKPVVAAVQGAAGRPGGGLGSRFRPISVSPAKSHASSRTSRGSASTKGSGSA